VGHVAEEIDDPGHEAKGGACAIVLPVVDGSLVDAEPFGHFPLQKPQIEPSLPQVVAEGLQFLRISR
jgi:hypothetical protein